MGNVGWRLCLSGLIYVPMSLGLCLLWGYGGVLSFGQTTFFGLAAYAYAIAAINFGDGVMNTWLAAAVALAVASFASVALGYFIFYGRISDVFVGIVTLSTTLILETFLAQTSGPEWRIGIARLNGYNGMTGMPVLELPWPGANIVLQDRTLFFASVVSTAATAFLLGFLRRNRSGLGLIATRDNKLRAEALGYDTAGVKLAAFAVSGFLAAVSGILYVNWGEYITPSSMSLTAAAAPVIWVSVGGRTSVGGVVVATVGLLWASQQLAVYGDQWALVLLGLLAVGSTLVNGGILGPIKGFMLRLVRLIKPR
jgi:ABC-type branched-subunit amino acid transport system permease subunit